MTPPTTTTLPTPRGLLLRGGRLIGLSVRGAATHLGDVRPVHHEAQDVLKRLPLHTRHNRKRARETHTCGGSDPVYGRRHAVEAREVVFGGLGRGCFSARIPALHPPSHQKMNGDTLR